MFAPIEDLYRLVVPESSILTLRLEARDQVDLDLYVFDGFPGGATSPVVAGSSARRRTLMLLHIRQG